MKDKDTEKEKKPRFHALRRVVFHNFWIKILAFALALIIYLTLRSGIDMGDTGYFTGSPTAVQQVLQTTQGRPEAPQAAPGAQSQPGPQGAQNRRDRRNNDVKDGKSNAER